MNKSQNWSIKIGPEFVKTLKEPKSIWIEIDKNNLLTKLQIELSGKTKLSKVKEETTNYRFKIKTIDYQ